MTAPMSPLKRPKPTTVVLGLLCVMYLITYVDRVNISTAADAIRRELSLSNVQLGFLQSAFGYPYLVFQIFGALAEFERNLIRERTLAGLDSARARGKMGGRRSKLSAAQVKLLYQLYDEKQRTVKEICGILGNSRTALYQYLERRKAGVGDDA